MSEQVTHKIPVWESTVAPSPKGTLPFHRVIEKC